MTIKAAGLKLLAKFLALSPIRDAIKAYAFRTPHRHLYDTDGSLYMGRWRLVDEKAGTPYPNTGDAVTDELIALDQKLQPPREWSARLHHINRADHDRELHNHPFTFQTFVIDGWYDEVYLDAAGLEHRHRISAGQTAHSDGAFHRIAAVSPGGVWTVFVMGKNHGEWGFRVFDRHTQVWTYMESEEYFRRFRVGPQAAMQ